MADLVGKPKGNGGVESIVPSIGSDWIQSVSVWHRQTGMHLHSNGFHNVYLPFHPFMSRNIYLPELICPGNIKIQSCDGMGDRTAAGQRCDL